MCIAEFSAIARPPITGVLFDLDNTLYDLEAAFSTCLYAFIRSSLPDCSDGEADALAEPAIRRDPTGYGSKADAFVELTRKLPSWTPTPEQSKSLFYDLLLDHIRLGERASAVLAELDSRRIPFGIVTNGTARQWRKIERLGLDTRAACVFVSEEFGAAKPDASIFLAAAAALGSHPTNVLFAGDHPMYDIAGARAVGMTTCWIQRGQPWPAADVAEAPDITVATLA